MSKYLNILIFGLLVVIGCEDAEEPDTTPPVVTIQSPLGGDEVSGVVSVQVNATDNDGLEKVELYSTANGLEGTSTTDATIHTFEWNSDAIDNGQYGLYAVAYDDAGNSTTSQTIQVDVKNSVIVYFQNMTHTVLGLQFGQGETVELETYIPAYVTIEHEVDKDRGTMRVNALTSGEYGLVLGYDYNIEISNIDHNADFGYDGTYMYLTLTNNSSYEATEFWVNYGLTSELGYDIFQPNNGNMYGIGYYFAFSNSNARIYSDDDIWVYWSFDLGPALEFGSEQYLNLNFDASVSLTGGSNPVSENLRIPTLVIDKPDGEIDFSIFD